MGILSRFADIVSSNINDLLDKAENPEKMAKQYLRQAVEDLAEVKSRLPASWQMKNSVNAGLMKQKRLLTNTWFWHRRLSLPVMTMMLASS